MHRKKSREEVFLDEMNVILPWSGLNQVIVAFYPSPKRTGRRLIGIGYMLRIYFFQRWFKLTDPVAGFYQCSSKKHKPETALHA